MSARRCGTCRDGTAPSRRIFSARTLVVAALLHADIAVAAVVSSPDEICSPASDPCIIEREFEVDAATSLDFGLRTVVVTSEGHLTGTLDLLCGAFVSEQLGTWMRIVSETGRGDVTITALRRCSGSPALACLDDAACEDALAGTCSGGDGTIRLAGTMQGNAPGIRLRSAGDIALEGTIRANGQPPFADGGSIDIESFQGSIESNALLDVTAGRDPDYGASGGGGDVTLRAGLDITMRDEIQAAGGGATITVDAGRDVVVGSSMFVQGRDNAYMGGNIDLNAGRDLRVVTVASRDVPLLNISGGTSHGYYGYGGAGGYGFFNAGGDIAVARGTHLIGNSGRSTLGDDSDPFNGNFYFEAGGHVAFDGKMTAQGLGPWGGAWGVMSFTGRSVSLGAKSRINTVSAFAPGLVVVGTDFGRVSMYGRVDVRGRSVLADPGYVSGKGGDVTVYGGDVILGGRIFNGGGYYGGEMRFYACNLDLKQTARINGRFGRQTEEPFDTYFSVGRRMTAEPGSVVRGAKESEIRITYGDAAQPPQLSGIISPAPQFATNASTGSWLCPFCGDFTVESGESCDDGNTVGGDGCSADCQLEP